MLTSQEYSEFTAIDEWTKIYGLENLSDEEAELYQCYWHKLLFEGIPTEEIERQQRKEQEQKELEYEKKQIEKEMKKYGFKNAVDYKNWIEIHSM